MADVISLAAYRARPASRRAQAPERPQVRVRRWPSAKAEAARRWQRPSVTTTTPKPAA